MEELAKANLTVTREVMPKSQAIELFRGMGEDYKVAILQDIPDEIVSLYRQGDWADLCRGPHVPSTGAIKAFKLTGVAGAYWRGNEKNEMLQRIYGTAWPTKQALKEHLRLLEEAKKRDHRKLGRELDLFSFHRRRARLSILPSQGSYRLQRADCVRAPPLCALRLRRGDYAADSWMSNYGGGRVIMTTIAIACILPISMSGNSASNR